MINPLAIPSSNIIAVPRPGWIKDYLNARFRSLDIQLETVIEILSFYQLEIVAIPKNLPNTRRNRNLIVKTTNGKKILKEYRKDWHTSTITFEHSILNRLADLDFPSPRLLPSRNGQTWIHLGTKFFCIFDFIPGNNFSSRFLIRPQRVRMMATSGKMLALLHKQLAGFLPDGQHHLGFPNYSQDRDRDMDWHIAKVADLTDWSQRLKEREDSEQANWLIAHADKLIEEMIKLENTLSSAPLPRIIIHGDYGLHNLIYQNLDTAIPVDFELSRLEWRLVDLISVVSKFRYKDGSYDFESIIRFMKAYQAEYPISDEEWHYFPLVWKFYKLMKAVQYWKSYFETNGPVRKLLSARDEIGQASWAFDNPAWVVKFRRGGK
jgi:Ser/Thr protein kinase RdoA (MazF antagonist)